MDAVTKERRRLSVSTADAVAVGRRGSADLDNLKGDHDQLKRSNLFDLIKDEIPEGKKAVSYTSFADPEQNRKPSFAEKNSEVLIPPWLPNQDKEKADAPTWLRSLGLGWCCRKGLKPESPNQDSYSVLVVEDTFTLLGVYDGHGANGHFVSDLVRDILPKIFLTHPDRRTNVKQAFENSFVYCQRIIEQGPACTSVDANTSGTTCTMAFIQGDNVTIAHVADSRAVIGSSQGAQLPEDLTIDHKPNLPEERRRIEGAKPPGRVVFDGFFNHRVFAAGKMYPGLNMSRALGDVAAHKEAGLTAFPDIKEFALSEAKYRGSQTMLLCSDGVWEFLESKDVLKAGEFSGLPSDNQRAVEKIASVSYKKWMEDSDNEVADDITGIICTLQSGHRSGQPW